ncbi:acetoacetyl-CoA synthase [Pyronema omphalodes]|nr:acetoacetyl-CoA synthase [Pyronema omphalodes]
MSEEIKTPRLLWKHPDPKSTSFEKFKVHINAKYGLKLETYKEFRQWSIDNLSDFWGSLWDYEDSGIIKEGQYTSVVDESARMDSIPDWFPGVKINYAENALFVAGPNGARSKAGKEDSKIAVTSIREGFTEDTPYTWGQLRQMTGHYSQALRAHGVKKGDRVAGVVSNSTEALVLMLAVTALGAIYSSSATDMGTKGILDRMVQIEPTFIFMDDAAVYNRKEIDLRPKMKEIVEGMSKVSCFKGLVSLPRWKKPVDVSSVPRAQTMEEFLKAAKSDELVFERVPFRYPFYIAYSSGTTGKPKCIVHCGGGAVLGSRKEQLLHHLVDKDSVYLQYTTTGWIMYLVQVTSLLPGAHVLLYDGSPFQPGPEAFINIMGQKKITHLGTSPKYFAELQLRGISPRKQTDLSNLISVTSTGMVLSSALFDWFYDEGFPARAQLSNITGGTDINGALALSNPVEPLYSGECQCFTTGIAADVYKTVDNPEGVRAKGVRAPAGEPGELVVTKAYPSMPTMFWGEGGAQQYFNSYFAKYDDVWTQGDFAMVHPHTGGLVMLGRADGVLNPSGVRFGSSEIYSIIETHFTTEIADSIAVGQRRPQDLDESVILFLMMKPGQKFTPQLVKRVKDAIAKGLSKRHVPKYVFETFDIPTTINFKKVELPVKQIVCGKKITPSGTLRNPESLQFYYQFVEIEKMASEGKAKL